MLVRFDHIASVIVNANHRIVRSVAVLSVVDCVCDGIRFADVLGCFGSSLSCRSPGDLGQFFNLFPKLHAEKSEDTVVPGGNAALHAHRVWGAVIFLSPPTRGRDLFT